MNLIYDFTKINFTSGRNGNYIKALVIHDTGNNTDTAEGNANYFRDIKRGASAHYFVDNDSVVQVVREKDTAWHCGKANYGNYYNTNTIGIEMCRTNNKVTNYTLKNTAELLKDLCQKYDIKSDKILMHRNVANTPCPSAISDKEFLDLKNMVFNDFIGDTGGNEIMSKIYKNGSTIENVYADSDCNLKIGFLDSFESCKCYGIFEDKAIVLYKINGTENEKVGFVKWLGGVR